MKLIFKLYEIKFCNYLGLDDCGFSVSSNTNKKIYKMTAIINFLLFYDLILMFFELVLLNNAGKTD